MPIFRFVVYGIAKTLSKVFGLATMAFFGRMPSRDDDKLAGVGLIAVSWVPVVVAIFWPALAEFIIPFAPDDETDAAVDRHRVDRADAAARRHPGRAGAQPPGRRRTEPRRRRRCTATGTRP
jgi:hypothetical protein